MGQMNNVTFTMQQKSNLKLKIPPQNKYAPKCNPGDNPPRKLLPVHKRGVPPYNNNLVLIKAEYFILGVTVLGGGGCPRGFIFGDSFPWGRG